MATGVKPRDEDTQFSRSDLEAIQDALKNKKFRELLTEYCEEVRDPANQALYQKEMTQFEKERGYDVTFINPKGGYVIKTSVAGDRKAFINICSNDNIGKPSHNIQEVNGKRGMNWQIPYSLLPPREDYDQNKKRCVIYDVVFHPNTLRMAEVNKQFRELVNNTAFEGLQKTYNIHLDVNNFRLPKSSYKGMAVPAVIRKEDPNYKPPDEEESQELSPEIMEKLYPQHSYSDQNTEVFKASKPVIDQWKKPRKVLSEFNHITDNGYTIPKYVIKQQKNIDLQEFTYHRESKQYCAIPSQIVIEVNLPLLSSTKECTLDVKEQSLYLISEKPAKYKLNISLPYPVNEECGNAKFDKSLHKLIVTLPVVKKNLVQTNKDSHKIDSGLESESNASQSDEENNNFSNLVTELSSTESKIQEIIEPCTQNRINNFFEESLAYTLPKYTYNILDDVVALTFHVKNTEPDSVEVKTDGSKINIKFTSTGSGFVPIHYAATIVFNDNVVFENVVGEAWDNNVILQIELNSNVPQKFLIGLGDSLTEEHLDNSQLKKNYSSSEENPSTAVTELVTPVVEVTNLGSETNILVSTNVDDCDDDIDSYTLEDRKIVWTETYRSETGAKSILRKSSSRSYSESSIGDIASSMDYISSDCIPEESSFKKTVRFNNVIARQFYRYNSSIEGQKKKNQRKKSKKRNLERRKSESEAEEECGNTLQSSKQRSKSALKQRRDSGLADTSDAEECKTSDSYNNHEFNINDKPTKYVNKAGIVDAKSEFRDSGKHSKKVEGDSINCENIKHKTDLYDPERLNKGKYLEVSFKNDLIFDLDM